MPRKKGKAGDWMESEGAPTLKPSSHMAPPTHPYDPEAIFDEFRAPAKSALTEAMEAVASGKAVVDDAVLFHGRFDGDGKLLRESEGDEKPYRMVRVRGGDAFREKLAESKRAFEALPDRIREAQSMADKRTDAARRVATSEDEFQSLSDGGSLMANDPNQFTEFTPYFSGPWGKQQYYDYFKMHARAFEEWNHNPIAKRIINILAQYALGRGFKVAVKNDEIKDAWDKHAKDVKLYNKLRKFWSREYLIYGELMIDKEKWQSIDPSTIWEIVTDDEDIENVYYYQQMFQTITQTYAGIAVPGAPGSGDTTVGHYVIRQIPFDRVMHIKTECVSNEKRGRSVLFSVLGWCKRIKDLYNALVVGEQGRAVFIFDDLIKGSDADVAAHAARYAYMPPAGSTFAHNEAIERKPMPAMAGVSPSRDGVGQEILAMIATAIGIPKEHLNVIASGGGNRATAIVGAEPFTKVIEDLQQDFEDLFYQLAESWCDDNGFDFNAEDWECIFPSVTKDTTGESLKNIATAESMNWINKRRAGTMAAAELEITNYDFDDEQEESAADSKAAMAKGLTLPQQPPPAGRFGQPAAQPQDGEQSPDNPIHGPGKGKLKKHLSSL